MASGASVLGASVLATGLSVLDNDDSEDERLSGSENCEPENNDLLSLSASSGGDDLPVQPPAGGDSARSFKRRAKQIQRIKQKVTKLAEECRSTGLGYLAFVIEPLPPMTKQALSAVSAPVKTAHVDSWVSGPTACAYNQACQPAQALQRFSSIAEMCVRVVSLCAFV